jgi:hypothetical protein
MRVRRSASFAAVAPAFVVAAVSCANGKVTTLSPDDSHYCQHCPCEPGPVSCPNNDPSLCTLSALFASQGSRTREEASGRAIRSPMVTGAWSCGRYVVVDELCGTDCGATYAYDDSSGQVIASRTGGGVAWLACKDGYRSNWRTEPPGFVFPPRKECTEIKLRD